MSLRCPACGRPFLSLPQQPGAYVTCPHCAQSAPMHAFSPAGDPSSALAVPLRRRIVQRSDGPAESAFRSSLPAYSPSAPATFSPPTAFPSAPTQRVPQPFQRAAAAPSWPPAPEQAPMFSPPTAPVYPAAPVSEPLWNAPIASMPTASPFAVAEASVMPPPRPQEVPLFRMAAPSQEPIDLPLHAPAQEVPMTEWQPPPQRTPLLPAILFLIVVVSGCLWILRDEWLPPLVAEIPVPSQPATAPEVAPMQEPAPAPKIVEPEPEIRRAELPLLPSKPVDLVAAGEAAQTLFLQLLEATTHEERLRLIAQPEEHGSDLAEFFAAQKLELISLKPSAVTPHWLPGQQITPLFQVATRNAPGGALLRLVPKVDGGFLLDWPLFAETHQAKLAAFLKARPSEPAWFHLSLRRSHALDLPETLRATHVCLDLQGSATGTVATLAMAAKETPIGRYLSREVEWGTVYVGRLLLQHRQLDQGTWSLVILDCEGAATGSAR